MPADIGIDLGTTKIIIYDTSRGIVLCEPTIVAVDTETGGILRVGAEAYKMIGRTPSRIAVIRPLEKGVISDYRLTNAIIRYSLQKVCGEIYFRPRVTVCVPSAITDIEQRAVVEAAIAAGARKVFLIEEPVAAAIGAGLDISKPVGRMVVDIGGGTTDIAVLSLSGVVCKNSVKVAGNRFDEEIIRYIRAKHGLLIGDRTAEETKKAIGTCWSFDDDRTFDVRGRNLMTGLPGRARVGWQEISEICYELAAQIALAIQRVFEKTPPELAGDIRTFGVLLTGGGARLHGLDLYLTKRLGTEFRVAENPAECVAIGTGKSFEFTGYLRDCVTEMGRTHN